MSALKRHQSANPGGRIPKQPPHLSYLNPAAISGGRGTSAMSGTMSVHSNRPGTAGTVLDSMHGSMSPTRAGAKSKFRGTTFLKDTSQSEDVLPRPLPSGITYAANFASFEELMERNILEQKQEHMVSLSTEDVSAIYHAKCMDQRLAPSWEREARFMELLSQNCKGMFFELKENGLGPHATAAVCQVLARNTLYSIVELSGNRLRDNGAECIAELLRVNTTIVHLALRSNDIGQEGGKKIADALVRNNTLTSLDLSGISGINRNHLGQRGAEAMGNALSVNKTLCIINLGSNGLGVEGMERLKRGLENNEAVTSLNLSSNNLGAEGAAILAEALVESCIKTLNLERNNIGDRGCAALAAAMRVGRDGGGIGDHLESISLAHNNIRAAGMEQLAKALPMAHAMKVLVLEGNHCGEGGYHLAVAMRDTRISEWHMNSCDLQPGHGERMGDALAYSQMVEVLDISRNQMGDEGMLPILRAAQTHPKLRILNMNNVGTTDAVGKGIAAALGMSKTLQEVHVRQNNLKESGDLIADVLRKNFTMINLDALFNDFSYRAFSNVELYIGRNRKTWNHNAVPRLSAEIAELNSSEKELARVQDEMEAERRSMKDKMDEGFRRKETAKNHLETMRKQNAEWEAQWMALKEITTELDRKYNDLSDVVQREKSKMDGKQNATENKRKMEEDKKLEFGKRADMCEKKLKDFMATEAEAMRAPLEELHKWEGDRDRERGDARIQGEALVMTEIKLLELQILLGTAGLVALEAVEETPEAQPVAVDPKAAPVPPATKGAPKAPPAAPADAKAPAKAPGMAPK